MCVLEEVGIEFLNQEALEILAKSGGCKISENNVRMDREFVCEMLARAPSQFTITPRNPDKKITIGGQSIVFGAVSSPPNYWDIDVGKQPGRHEQCRNMIKLAQYFNCIHFTGGYPVEPSDIHASMRHLDIGADKLLLTDKVCHAYSLGKERIEDVMEMVRLAAGITHEEFEATPHMYTNINSTSPLKHDYLMLDGYIRCVRRGQVTVVSPFTLSGAMAPITMTGAVVLSLAEGLCTIAMAQYIRPGAPCVFGTFTSNVDMKSGAPAFGTPEYIRATQMTGQMVRHYGIPLRSSGASTANVPDGQSMWETLNSLWAAVQSQTNMVYHAAGWMEGGLLASPEKFIMDCEVLQQFQRYFEPIIHRTTEDDLAVDAIKEVGPFNHYFGCQHTQDRYQTAYYSPFISDWTNYEGWHATGGVWTAERANKMFKRIINEFEEPPIDLGCKEAVVEFVAKRKTEGGAPTDF